LLEDITSEVTRFKEGDETVVNAAKSARKRQQNDKDKDGAEAVLTGESEVELNSMFPTLEKNSQK
jgi:hypothetical protein